MLYAHTIDTLGFKWKPEKVQRHAAYHQITCEVIKKIES